MPRSSRIIHAKPCLRFGPLLHKVQASPEQRNSETINTSPQHTRSYSSPQNTSCASGAECCNLRKTCSASRLKNIHCRAPSLMNYINIGSYIGPLSPIHLHPIPQPLQLLWDPCLSTCSFSMVSGPRPLESQLVIVVEIPVKTMAWQSNTSFIIVIRVPM